MAYTEKVSLSGTALSFLLYECINSKNGQEGFLIGDITSEITNHISDSQSDHARLDTQIVIRAVLPLPSVSLFYCPTGRIKEDILSELLSNSASEVVGWYKYRRNSNIKPTFRDKLISKGLQKYFERIHGKKNFVTCSLSNKSSVCSSTHTFTYRFGKINCFEIFEYIEDVTGNLGEKVTGYKKPHRHSRHSIFNKIIKESNVQNETTTEAILHIQEAVNTRLTNEARIAVKHENAIRELEAEISEMTAILSDRHVGELQAAYEDLIESEKVNPEVEMVTACVEALKDPPVDPELEIRDNETNHISSHNDSIACDTKTSHQLSLNPVLPAKKSVPSYAVALKNKPNVPATSNSTTNNIQEDLINFDVEDSNVVKMPVTVNNDVTYVRESSPEY